jgi:RNA recognition motif-containing protein
VLLLCDATLSQEDVRRLFDKYGEVKDVYIPMNYHTK